MQDETYEQMSARIEQLETTMNAVGGGAASHELQPSD